MTSTKVVTGGLPWSDKKVWTFPADDTRTGRSFRDGPGDLDTAIPMLLPHLSGRRTCIQAGACLGIWPLRLAQFFNRVITFEPEPTNHLCAVRNTSHLSNVEVHHAALGDDSSLVVQMRLDAAEAGNSGAHYAVNGGNIPVMVIDEMGLTDVDLIYLDIEGSESLALQGAIETIMKCRPVVGIEVKQLHKKRHHADPVELIKSMGYCSIGRPFSLDEIFAPK